MSDECSGRDCESVIRALWDFLDAELDNQSAAEIHTHLEACEHCRSHADFEKRLIDELVVLRREHTDAAALRARVEAALREAKLKG